jgi:hypothetical protein
LKPTCTPPSKRRATFRQGTYEGTSPADFCTDLNRKLTFAKDHEPQLAAVGDCKDFQSKLEIKLRALEADSGVERDGAAIASLLDNNRVFCEAKGRLYFILKDIINAARALHSKEPKAAAKYYLKGLYRRVAKECEGSATGADGSKVAEGMSAAGQSQRRPTHDCTILMASLLEVV